jgi:hypothetical protein
MGFVQNAPNWVSNQQISKTINDLGDMGGFSRKFYSAQIPIVTPLVDEFGNMVLPKIMLLCFHDIQTYPTTIK